MSFLGGYTDPAMRVDEALPLEQLASDESERLANSLAIVLAAYAVPRRLGGEASNQELARDKRTGRRVLHALQQAHAQWADQNGRQLEVTEEHRQKGAKLSWTEFGRNHRIDLDTRLRYVATWAAKTGNKREGRTLLVKLQNEKRWVEYALR